MKSKTICTLNGISMKIMKYVKNIFLQITDQFHYFQLYPKSLKKLYSVNLMIFFIKEKPFYGSQYGFRK